MMLRRLHVAILRNAALLVPPPERGEWLAEWKAELYYVNHDATTFCLGSFRDALWLRRKSFSVRRLFSLDSPLRCVMLLTAAAVLTSLCAFGFPSLKSLLEACSPTGIEQFALGCVGLYAESLLVLVTLNPLELGEYPANQYAPSLIVRLRRWIFLNVKIILLTSIFLFASIALLPIFPAAPSILLFGWIFGFRWGLADQRQRCPVCLHLLSNPTRIGSPTQTILGWYGTELICARGHGLLYVPGSPTSWCSKQRWQYLDPT
ncbi:MAG TPA: hypothetical protein VND42_02645 [Candidatus Acidoferrales bacterium]|nr:hypothetical protein [Candidatus Acidoferrales bacterium]